VIGGIIIILIALGLVKRSLNYRTAGISFTANEYVNQSYIRALLSASVVEIALFWLLVYLNILSQRHSMIATLVLVILVGITFFLSNIITL
jgi:hypothetical protein